MKKIAIITSLIAQFCLAQTPQLAYDIYPGPNSSNPANPVLFGGNMYFSAYFSGYGSELTRFDGTSMPIRVADIYPGFNSSMFDPDPIVFNGKLYFTATDGMTGYELWSYDGTNPPTMVSDIRPGNASSFPDRFTIYNNKLYFYANNGVNGGEIWQYDGINPPAMLLDMFAGTSTSSSLADHFCEFNGKLYFSAKDSSGPAKIWQYDGISLPVQVFPNHIAPSYMISYNGKMYLASYNISISSVEYLNFDGSALNIEPNITGPIQASLNGTVYFFNIPSVATYGYELWKFDGFSPPSITADINPGNASSNPANVTAYNNKIYFVADDGNHGYEIWVYDGINALLTGEITPTIIDPAITFMKIYNNRIYFNANNGAATGQNGAELWMIDTPLSVADYEKSKVILYPNPIERDLNISSEIEFDAINLYDINNRNLFHKTFQSTKNTQISLDLPTGFYTLSLSQNGLKISNKKMIVR